jgi:hypothetical protein
MQAALYGFITQKILHLVTIKRISGKQFASKFFAVVKEWISGHYRKSLNYRSSRPLVYVLKDLLGIKIFFFKLISKR